MPLTTVYDVRTRYRVDTDDAEKNVGRLRSKLQGLWDTMKIALAGGAAFGLGKMASDMLRIGKNTEEMKIGVASTFQLLNDEVDTFNQGMERADTLMEMFTERAITSPASKRDFANLFQAAAPAIAGLGLDNSTMADFTQRLVGAAKSLNVDFQQAGRDIRQILEGRAGVDVKLFQPLRGKLEEALNVEGTEGFNQLVRSDPRRAFEALNKVLSNFDAANDAAKDSVGGLWTTLRGMYEETLLDVFAGMESALKREMSDFSEWFLDNEDTISSWANSVGDSLGNAFDTAADGLVRLTDGLRWIVNNRDRLMLAGGLYAGARGAGVAQTAAVNFQETQMAADIAELGIAGAGSKRVRGLGRRALDTAYGAMYRGGGAAVRGVQSVGAAAGRGRRMAGRAIDGARKVRSRGVFASIAAMLPGITELLSWGAGGGAFGSISGWLSGLAASLGGLSTVLTGGTILVAIGAIVGAWRTLGDKTNEATQFFWNSISYVTDQLSGLTRDLGLGSLGDAAAAVGSGIMWLVDLLGEGLLYVLGAVNYAVGGLIAGFRGLIGVLKGTAYFIGNLFSELLNNPMSFATSPADTMRRAFEDAFNDAAREFKNNTDPSRMMSNTFAPMDPDRLGQQAVEDLNLYLVPGASESWQSQDEMVKDLEKSTKEKKNQGGGDTNIDVTVDQTIESEADPDRIAFRTAEVVGDAVSGAAPQTAVAKPFDR